MFRALHQRQLLGQCQLTFILCPMLVGTKTNTKKKKKNDKLSLIANGFRADGVVMATAVGNITSEFRCVCVRACVCVCAHACPVHPPCAVDRRSRNPLLLLLLLLLLATDIHFHRLYFFKGCYY